MRLPDGTILMHADHAPYDPAKAHEYYLRTRKLHPRQPGASYTVTTASGGTVKLSPKEYAEQSAYAAHRVAQIKANLVKMKADLRKRVFEAKQRERDANKPKTAADKAKAAADAKKYRQQHKQELRNKARQQAAKDKAAKSGGSTPGDKSNAKDSKSTGTETTADLKYSIHQAQTNLKAAVEKQRALATATKNG